MKTLNDYFPNAINGNGLFTEISKIEWFEGLEPSSFDTYFSLKVGTRLASNSLSFFADSDGIVSGEKLTKLAKTIYNINKISWRNIYRDLTVEYNPIENTDYIETVKDVGGSSGSASTTSAGNGSASDSITNGKYAFNSSESVPDTTVSQTSSNSTSATTSSQSSGSTNNDR